VLPELALKRFWNIRILEDVERGEDPGEGILSAPIVGYPARGM